MVLVISAQTVVASADAHQLHSEDVSSAGVDEHSHIIGSSGLVESLVLNANLDDRSVASADCEHGHVHASSASFTITASTTFYLQEGYFKPCMSLQPSPHHGIHSLPFRPPIS